jgi:tetratricopeptide (TPR) repeat protein
VLGVVVLAALLRLWGITDRLPDPTLGINVLDDSAVEETDRTTIGRAWAMWGGGTKPLDLNPHTSGWPALSFYITLALQWLYGMAFGLLHPGTDAAAFARHVQLQSRELFLFARVVSALVGVASVFLTCRLGALLAGREVGIGAGLLLAASPLHILTSQHVSDPNLLALFFVLLAAIPMARIASGRARPRDSLVAGAMIGLAGACKFVPLVLMLPLLLAHPRGARNRWLWIAGGAALAAMFVATPYTFLDWKTTLRDIVVQRRALLSDWVGQTQFPISLPTYLGVSLPHGMGWPAYLLALAGLVLLWRTGAAGRAIALVPVVMVAAIGLLKTAQERYVLAALPVLCAAATLALVRGAAWWRERGFRGPGAFRAPAAAIAAPALAGALAIAWPLPELVRTREALRLPDTRHIARRWIQENIPAAAPQLIELYGPVFQAEERNFLIWPFFATQAPLVRPAYHPAFLDGIAYAALSGEISRRFESDPANYPVETAYYRWLRERARTVWTTEGMKAAGPAIVVRSLPPSISTRAERESLFKALVPKPTRTTRLALWCADMSALFGRMGLNDRAEEWALRGLRVNASNMNAQLYAALALARLRLGKAAEAEAAADAGIAVAPRAYSLHLYRGLAQRDQGRPEEALESLRRSLAIANDARVLFSIGQLLVQMRRYEEAVRELDRVPPGSPERGPARREMAILYLNFLGRRAEGIAALREAASLEPDPDEARLLRNEVDRLTKGGP